jgi:hypothetical protein
MTWFPSHARNFPHRLAPGYLSDHLVSSRERRAAAVRHGCHPVGSTSGSRLEPIDPVVAPIAPPRPMCRALDSTMQPLPPPQSLVYDIRRRRLGPSPVSSVRQPLSQPTAASNLPLGLHKDSTIACCPAPLVGSPEQHFQRSPSSDCIAPTHQSNPYPKSVTNRP